MVEYHKMRPRAITERKKQLPVCYIGLGILEWHGLHNPVGLDSLKAHGIACYMAERLGGVAMPPLYWGDNRDEICERHLDPVAREDHWYYKDKPHEVDHAASICETMELTKADYDVAASYSKSNGGWELWISLVTHMFVQMESLGFELIVPIPGHYPLIQPLEEAIERYRKRSTAKEVIILTEKIFHMEGKPTPDHAGAFETSLMLAIDPEVVDLGELDPDLSTKLIGVLGQDPRVHASAENGNEILNYLVPYMKQILQKHFKEDFN